MFGNQVGLQSLLKEGGKHYAGVDEALLKNLEAGKRLAEVARSSLGPYGMNKLIINHLDKHFVTSDTATMLKEMEIQHPAAKIVCMASDAQQQECGDATNFVVTLAGELFAHAEELMKQGIHATGIIRAYELASEHGLKELEKLSVWAPSEGDLKQIDTLKKCVRTCLCAKQYGLEDQLSELIATACLQVMPAKASDFDMDSVRVAKLPGSGSLAGSYVVDGMVLPRDVLGVTKRAEKAKVAVFGVGLEMTTTETGGTVMLESAAQLLDYTKGEERQMEEFVKSLSDAGVKVAIAGGSVQDIALHYLNKYGIICIKCTSKFELRRLCKTVGATSIARLGAPLPDELGFAEYVGVEEVGSARVTVVRGPDSRIATIVLRGATKNMLDEVERAIDDAVNVVRCVCTKDARFCAGAGAAEVAVARSVIALGESMPGLEHYAVLKFAEALLAIPRLLAANAGLKVNPCLAEVNAAHAKGDTTTGVNVDGLLEGSLVLDASERSILDHLLTKHWALRIAVDAALTVLRIDHIIMAKQAGGPKPGANPNVNDD